MVSRVLKWIGLGFISLVVLLAVVYFSFFHMNFENARECEVDDDCIKAAPSCCPDKLATINKKYNDRQERWYSFVCGDSLCPAVESKDITIVADVKCIESKCSFDTEDDSVCEQKSKMSEVANCYRKFTRFHNDTNYCYKIDNESEDGTFWQESCLNVLKSI